MIPTPLRRFQKSAAVVFAGLAIVISLTACGSGNDSPKGADGLTAGNQEAAFDDWRIEFDACLKEQGVDTQSFSVSSSGSESGDSSTGAIDAGEIDTDAFEKAYKHCTEKVGQPPVDPNAPSKEESEEQMLALAKCMRDAGVDFPDPQVNDDGSVMMTMGEEFDPAVMEQCNKETTKPGGEN